MSKPRHWHERFGGAPPAEGENAYRAWNTCKEGSVTHFKLVPQGASGEPIRSVPYLQTISMEFRPDTGQLCLICHGTAMTVFLEGRGLEELADLIGEKRIRAIHVYDETKHTTPPDNQAAVISSIIVDKSS